ncbi:hypothetical protein PRZ48_011268 [Zasmidium cellare]|uniref:Uncharacterized protein n=1 Tax=Zasmidium cellare TaxID=395010 RepID=A0ABR0EAV3_ZASCE|nr:hypothetical protein PRZ48_011268 [Zasmidium cellare]
MNDKQNIIERWDINYNSEQRWYYMSRMKPEECLLIKIFDSEKNGMARCGPHSAFESDLDEGPARESIEVRTMVFWDDE